MIIKSKLEESINKAKRNASTNKNKFKPWMNQKLIDLKYSTTTHRIFWAISISIVLTLFLLII